MKTYKSHGCRAAPSRAVGLSSMLSNWRSNAVTAGTSLSRIVVYQDLGGFCSVECTVTPTGTRKLQKPSPSLSRVGTSFILWDRA